MSDTPSPKELQSKGWTGVVPGWKSHDATMVRLTGVVAERLLDLAGVGPGSRVLDIGCGTGEPAIPAAKRVGLTGSVLATDFVEPTLALAREKAAVAGLNNVEFRCMLSEDLDVPANSFDVVTSRWGTIFMLDVVSCLRQARCALKTGGGVAVAAWAEPERNPWAAIPMSILMKHADVSRPPPGAPGIFAYADSARLKGALQVGPTRSNSQRRSHSCSRSSRRNSGHSPSARSPPRSSGCPRVAGRCSRERLGWR